MVYIMNQNEFFTKIVGTTFVENSQNMLSRLNQGDKLEVIRERDNLVDPNAISIYFGDQKLGYISARIAKKLATEIDYGIKYMVTIENITGSTDKNLGANIKLKIDPKQDVDIVNKIKELAKEVSKLKYLYEHDKKYKYYYLVKKNKIKKKLEDFSKKLGR